MINKAAYPASIYVELDALLDTRLGTLAKISPDLAAQVLSNGYHARTTDTFTGVDSATFNTLYSQRDVETLKLSVVTGIVPVLRDLAEKLTEQMQNRPYHDAITLVVNLYPYQLDSEEQDLIGKSIATLLSGTASVEVVNIASINLTPLHCKQHFSSMVMYDYDSWMSLHTDNFKLARLPDVLVFSPAIYFTGSEPTKEEMDFAVNQANHPFVATEMAAAPLVDLQLIDIKYFSIAT